MKSVINVLNILSVIIIAIGLFGTYRFIEIYHNDKFETTTVEVSILDTQKIELVKGITISLSNCKSETDKDVRLLNVLDKMHEMYDSTSYRQEIYLYSTNDLYIPVLSWLCGVNEDDLKARYLIYIICSLSILLFFRLITAFLKSRLKHPKLIKENSI